MPVPDIATLWGLPVALSVSVTAADLAPVEVGAKVTLMLQLEPIARLEPQVCDSENWLALVPVTEMLEIAKAAVPVFVNVTISGALALLMV